jgi:hypothetical protein
MTDISHGSPYLTGLIVGLIFAGAVIVSVVWAPWFWNPASEWWHELVFMSACIVGLLFSRYWRHRTRRRFWASIALFLVANSIAVVYFIDRVRNFRPGNYIPIVFCEVFVSFLAFDWFLGARKRKNRPDSNGEG